MTGETVKELVSENERQNDDKEFEKDQWRVERMLRAHAKKQVNLLKRAEEARRKKEASDYIRRRGIRMFYWHLPEPVIEEEPVEEKTDVDNKPKTHEELFGKFTVAFGYRCSMITDGVAVLEVHYAIRTEGDHFSRPGARMYIADRYRKPNGYNYTATVPEEDVNTSRVIKYIQREFIRNTKFIIAPRNFGKFLHGLLKNNAIQCLREDS